MKLWVKIYKKKGAYDYEDSLPKYDLGTIVGQKTFPPITYTYRAFN